MWQSQPGEEKTMTSHSCWRARRLSLGLLFLGSLCVPSVAFAQNCSLCYTQAAAAGVRIIQALRGGILILVVPPIAICAGLAVMAYKKRNQFNDGQPVDDLDELR